MASSSRHPSNGSSGANSKKVKADSSSEVYFQAGNDSFREARNKCSHAIRVFNDMGREAPAAQRVKAWKGVVNQGITNNTDELVTATAEISFKDPSIVPSAPLVIAPIFMDYGLRVHIAPTAFINRSCTILDTPVADVYIGEHANIGPNVTIVSVSHSMGLDSKSKRLSSGKDVKIGDGAWIGAEATILPGVSIGKRAVVGAGSVVTKSVPDYHLALGNPARVIKELGKGVEREPKDTVLTLEEALKK
ncbi:hypothetical protein G7046_g3325 [Stylonectria norvegica]|nr:hypothetical protein G7046_g3325 [Stylonectria norvegica]